MERTLDHLRERQSAPQSSPSMHQSPLHILMTPNIRNGNLFTLPGGYLPEGIRGSTSIIANASHILKANGVEFTPTAEGFISDDDTRQYGYGFIVEPATHTPIRQYYDLTGENRFEMTPASPQPDPKTPLELRHWSSVLARMQSLNYRRKQLNQYRADNEQLTVHNGQEAFVRAFGRHVQHLLRRTI